MASIVVPSFEADGISLLDVEIRTKLEMSFDGKHCHLEHGV
jgi:hypothetical protein